MKLIILTALITCSYGAKLNRVYLPPNTAQMSGGSSEFLQTPFLSSSSNVAGIRNRDNEGDFEGNNYANGDKRFNNEGRQINSFGSYERPERPRAALERNAGILRQVNQNDGEMYSYAFETENGIVGEENGVATNGVEAQGGYSYTGDDGQVYSVRYTAGQNGFVPEGDHLPTPPPVPQEILLALEQNARDEAAGIYDDGSYTEGKYTSTNDGYESPSFGHNGVNGNIINNSNDDSIVVNSAVNTEVNRQNQLGNGITKAYLPPGQRFSGNRNVALGFSGNHHRPSFNLRTGYNY